MTSRIKANRAIEIFALLLALVWTSAATAVVPGIEGTVTVGGGAGGNDLRAFQLWARPGYIVTGEGNTVYMWGYAQGIATPMNHPGPNLIAQVGEEIRVTLTNQLGAGVDTSMVFPGHVVDASGGTPGFMTNEAANGGNVTYTFTATHPGTYTYYSGTDTSLQTEMGLFGTIVVYPAAGQPSGGGTSGQAYDVDNSTFDFEYLYVLSEIDDAIHNMVENGLAAEVNMNERKPRYWLINGRTGPDTLFPTGAPYLPNQPNGSLSRTCVNHDVLMRVVGAGHDPHPFHTHGQNFRVIARDGRPRVSSAVSPVSDVGISDFTLTVNPGQTYDAIWTWKGENLGWDIYGHEPDPVTYPLPPHLPPLEANEDPADHGKPLPVLLPEDQFLTFGGFWSGSPFLGQDGTLPVGEGGLNPHGGMYYMWHSHTEFELINFDIFPGGMLTMMAVEGPGVDIDGTVCP